MGGGPGDLDQLPKLSRCHELENVCPSNHRITHQPRARFSIWQLMIAVAVMAAFLGNATWLAAVAINVALGWRSRRRVELLGGNPLLQVTRPWQKKLEISGLVLYATVVIASLGYLVLEENFTAPDTYGSYHLNRSIDTLLFSACIVLLLYWPCFRWTRLEFRDHGVVYDSDFWPWESIRDWSWDSGGYTLRLKVPYRILWYGIAQGDKRAVQEILERRLGVVSGRSQT